MPEKPILRHNAGWFYVQFHGTREKLPEDFLKVFGLFDRQFLVNVSDELSGQIFDQIFGQGFDEGLGGGGKP